MSSNPSLAAPGYGLPGPGPDTALRGSELRFPAPCPWITYTYQVIAYHARSLVGCVAFRLGRGLCQWMLPLPAQYVDVVGSSRRACSR